MKLKRVLVTLLSAMMIVLSFAGCSEEEMGIKLNVKQGDKFEVSANVTSNAVSGGEEVMNMNMDMGMNILYSEVSEDKVVSESSFSDFGGNMSVMGQTIDLSSPEFKEALGNIKDIKMIVTEDGKGNVINVETEGLEEGNASFDLSSYFDSVSNNMNLFNNVDFKEGAIVEIPLKKLLGEDKLAELGISDDVMIKIKPTKITDKVIEGKVVSDDMNLDGNTMKIRMDFVIDTEVGICTDLNYDIKVTMKDGSEGLVAMKMTIKKA